MVGEERAKPTFGAIGLSIKGVRGRKSGRAGEARGRASILILVLLAALGAGLLVWRSGGRPADRAAPAAPPLPSGRAEPDPLAPPADAGGRAGDGREAAGDPAPTLGAVAPAPEDPRFEGRGEIRGHVEVAGKAEFPRSWRLIVRPSTTVMGRERAEERTLEFNDGRQDFLVADLPLAGYDLIAEADGLNGRVHPVLLERRSPSPFLNLQLIPAGFLEGSVLDHAGLPAEGVPITLVHLDDERGAEEVATDALGKFRFARVLDGRYRLFVGRPSAPIVPDARTLSFQAPSMTLPPVELPPLATLDVQVVDSADRRGLPDVTVRGSGTGGGVFEGRTDAFGGLRLRHLPPGRYRIHFSREGYESYRLTVELSAGEELSLSRNMWSAP